MTTDTRTAAETYRCPKCDDVLAFTERSWECTGCRYVPPHGAD